MNNKHKHAGHIITIEGHSFKSNESGMWNLTEIWKILGLPNNKLPSQWRGKVTKRLTDMQKMHVEKIGIESITYADKQATLKYAGWVSEDFEDMVYAAFEAILEMPEVARSLLIRWSNLAITLKLSYWNVIRTTIEKLCRPLKRLVNVLTAGSLSASTRPYLTVI